MAHKTEWLTFYIVLKDPAEVKAQQAAHPYGVMVAPLTAATTYAAPWRGYDDPQTGAPYSWTPWSGANTKGGVFPLDVVQFNRKSGGFWIFGGTTTTYIWLGQFRLASNGVPVDAGVTQGPISLRRWVEGFETPGIQPTAASGTASGLVICRDAARHVGGYGLAIRGPNNQLYSLKLGDAAGYNPATTVGGIVNRNRSWERFYLRLRRKPTTGTVLFWRCRGVLGDATSPGLAMGITTSGQLALFSFDNVSYTLLATMTDSTYITEWDPVTNPKAWHKVDIIFRYATALTVPGKLIATAAVWIDNRPVFQSAAGCPGLVLSTGHDLSDMGNPQSGVTDLELDIDDWICADIPYLVDAGARVEYGNGKDFLSGSKVVCLRAKQFSANHNAAWTGDYRTLAQETFDLAAVPATLTTTTSAALLAIDSDDADVIDADPGKLGVAALMVMLRSSRGTTSGSIGVTLNGSTTTTNITQSATGSTAGGANAAIFGQVGTAAAFADLTPIELRHTKGADTTAAYVASLMAQVELIGEWGKEDHPRPNTTADQAIADAIIWPTPKGQHNAAYPHSPWALDSPNAPPIAPYIVVAGTYVGNNTGQDLAFRAPVHFFFVRPLTGGAGGFQWWSTMLASHRAFEQQLNPRLVHGLEDLSFTGSVNEQQQQQYLLRIAGTEAQINAIGVTYQYIAVMDPAGRFCLNTTVSHRSAEPLIVNKLVDAGFTPEWAFAWIELIGSTTNRLYAKHAGNAANKIAHYGGGAITTGLALGAGSVSTDTGVHTLGAAAIPLSLWRRADGNNDAGQPGVVAIGTWTGDGSASRAVSFAPSSGLRPVFALVFGETGNGVWRDPSHTGVNSTQGAGTDITTGITAGAIDGMSVGSSLNTNGIVYTYFVLMGSATAGNGGWSINGEFMPVEAASLPGTTPDVNDPTLIPGYVPPAAPGTIVPLPTDPDLDDGTDLPGTDLLCKDFTQLIANQALARLGISKQIAAIKTELSIEAVHARLHIQTDVDTTLRDVPWPFATRYFILPVVAGSPSSPVNADWVYSYRRPWDCVFERRLVASRGSAPDPTPPPFGIGSDSGGGLIYANVSPCTLEYTSRIFCPTYYGDALFKEALIWRHAASLAPALTRLEDKVRHALEQYAAVTAKARLILKPGNPGNPPAAVSAYDTSATDIAANVAVVNRALIRIGAKPISSFTDQSREAVAALAIFEDELRTVLRDFAWPFATSYATPAVVGGSLTAPLNSDWTFSYRLPTDWVAVRRLVTSTGRDYDPNPPRFRISTDATGGLLYTSEQSAVIEYTARTAGTVARSDALFRDALAWKLAAALAPAFATVVDPEIEEQRGRGPDKPDRIARTNPAQQQYARQRMVDYADRQYRIVLVKAEVAAGNESQQAPPGEAEWITGRE